MSAGSDDENTEYRVNSSLNNARIETSSQVMSTPSTRKFSIKAKMMKSVNKYDTDSDSDEDSQWRKLLTRSIKEANGGTPVKSQALTQSLKKHVEKTAEVKNKHGCTIDNMCPICLNKFSANRGSLECLHEFCFDCISEWSKTSTICPCCRRSFDSILKLMGSESKANIKNIERVSVEQKQFVVNTQYDHYTCYQCGLGDNQHVLLICDECDFYCCHVYCDHELDNLIPEGDWFCIYCRGNRRNRRHRSQSNPAVGSQNEQQINETEEESTPEKAVAQRTRSRDLEHRFGSHLSHLRNMRRAR